jgi:GT2 family glycosyltransferase
MSLARDQLGWGYVVDQLATRGSEPTDDTLDLSIVIPSYNVGQLLDACLTSIRQFPPGSPYEVIVVDNASSDRTVELIRHLHPDVQVVANVTNRGFGQAANQGLTLARGSFLLVLNPDTSVGPGTFDNLLAALRADPDLGMVGPLTRYPDGQIQSTRRRFPTLPVALLESTVLQQWLPESRWLRAYYVADRGTVRQDVDWLGGACLMVRRDVFRAVGGFDPRFFMYSEELDWCRRIRQAGWRIAFVPEAELVHHEGRSSEQNVARRASNFQESKARYFEKYQGAAVGRALRLFLLANTLADLGAEAAKLALGHRPALRIRRVKALLVVARSQLFPNGSLT